MSKKHNCLHPSVSLLSKIGSLIVHMEEASSGDGHPFDRVAIEQLMSDPEVMTFIREMESLALLPVTRNATKPTAGKGRGKKKEPKHG